MGAKSLKKRLKALDKRLTEFEESDTDWADGVDSRLNSLFGATSDIIQDITRIGERLTKIQQGGQSIILQDQIRDCVKRIEVVSQTALAAIQTANSAEDRVNRVVMPAIQTLQQFQQGQCEERTQTYAESAGMQGHLTPTELHEPPSFDDTTVIPVQEVDDMLGLVCKSVPMDIIERWTPGERYLAVRWAGQQHLMASDNEFDESEIIPCPHFVDFFSKKERFDR